MGTVANPASCAMIDEKPIAVRDAVVRRNPAEPEFRQAVHEVLLSLGPVVAKHPEFVRGKLMKRIAEPERQIILRVPWMDDRGEVHIDRGFRVEFNSALGPYKGGLGFIPPSTLGSSSSSAHRPKSCGSVSRS